MEDLANTSVSTEGALLGLPETQTELDVLTELNTAHNRRISMLGISTDDGSDVMKPATGTKRSAAMPAGTPKKRRLNVTFKDEVNIINPEDIDPTIPKLQSADDSAHHHSLRLQEISRGAALYSDLPASSSHPSHIGARLGLSLPNPAPDVELEAPEPAHAPPPHPEESGPSNEPKRKKYAKEAWPGRKPRLRPAVCPPSKEL